MISELTATVRAALDRRLQVERTLGVDALRPVSAEAGTTSFERETLTHATPVAQGKAALEFASRWPVGTTVAARVTGTGDANRILADIDGLPLELHWRGDDGAAPTVGQALAFRVLALRPEIVLQRLPNVIAPAESDPADTSTHISADAKVLHASAALAAYGVADERTVRFTTPLIADRADEAAAPHEVATGETSVSHAAASAAAESLAAGVRATTDPTLPFAPVILSGPAWRDQPIELIVRRRRHDERLDDPTQDDWCGELVIDLPHIGRVAGHLAWSMQGLRVRLDADLETSADALADAASELVAAFTDLRMRVAGLSIGPGIHAAGARDE